MRDTCLFSMLFQSRGKLAWGTLEQARCLSLLATHASGRLGLGGTTAAPTQVGGPPVRHDYCEGGASLNRAVLRHSLKPAALTWHRSEV